MTLNKVMRVWGQGSLTLRHFLVNYKGGFYYNFQFLLLFVCVLSRELCYVVLYYQILLIFFSQLKRELKWLPQVLHQILIYKILFFFQFLEICSVCSCVLLLGIALYLSRCDIMCQIIIDPLTKGILSCLLKKKIQDRERKLI